MTGVRLYLYREITIQPSESLIQIQCITLQQTKARHIKSELFTIESYILKSMYNCNLLLTPS